MVNGQILAAVCVLMSVGAGQQGTSRFDVKDALLKGEFGELKMSEAKMMSSGNTVYLEGPGGLSVRFAGVPDFTADQSRRAAGVISLRGDVRIQSSGAKVVATDCLIQDRTNQVRCEGNVRVTIVDFKEQRR